jgi:uncharacterized protein YhaN
MISFDIEKTPPTTEKIKRERHNINKRKKAKRTKATPLIAILLLVGSISLAYGSVIVLCIASTATLYILGDLIEDSEHITKRQSSISPIKEENCPEMLALCKKHEKIRLYQNAVAAMGRPLTHGEFLAARAWIDEAAAKESRTRQQEACATLASQV